MWVHGPPSMGSNAINIACSRLSVVGSKKSDSERKKARKEGSSGTQSRAGLSQIFNFGKQFRTCFLSPLSRLPRVLRRVQLLPQRIQAVLAVPRGPETKQIAGNSLFSFETLLIPVIDIHQEISCVYSDICWEQQLQRNIDLCLDMVQYELQILAQQKWVLLKLLDVVETKFITAEQGKKEETREIANHIFTIGLLFWRKTFSFTKLFDQCTSLVSFGTQNWGTVSLL